MNKGLKDKIIALYKAGKTYNQIKKELNCSKGTISFHVSDIAEERVHKINRENKEKITELIDKIRTLENLTIEIYNKTYKDLLPLKEFLKVRNEIFERKYITKELTSKEYHQNRRYKIKKELVELKGGKCSICGYNKSLRSLQFHHLDPKKKNFNISSNLKMIDKDICIKELDKCILVCANCHGEIHDKMSTLVLEAV